jgi:hypothetical protein
MNVSGFSTPLRQPYRCPDIGDDPSGAVDDAGKHRGLYNLAR